ncbi:peptidase S1 and S6, chymotrypsin/Hap [Rhodobacteraceae bacterium KLH11]|nr:peptidase S1 and S6, chymotrypsin/Hap [Rhodobacteraceae bacterium KLH11]
MSCNVDFGASGAPIFSFEGERPRIVSVVAAKAEMHGQRVALGTSLEQSLELLQAELSEGRGMNATLDNTTKTLGAKFLKP